VFPLQAAAAQAQQHELAQLQVALEAAVGDAADQASAVALTSKDPIESPIEF
jgi:hypothetical protein